MSVGDLHDSNSQTFASWYFSHSQIIKITYIFLALISSTVYMWNLFWRVAQAGEVSPEKEKLLVPGKHGHASCRISAPTNLILNKLKYLKWALFDQKKTRKTGIDRHIKTADKCELHSGELEKSRPNFSSLLYYRSCLFWLYIFKCPMFGNHPILMSLQFFPSQGRGWIWVSSDGPSNPN